MFNLLTLAQSSFLLPDLITITSLEVIYAKREAFQSRTVPYPLTFASAHGNLMFVCTWPQV